MADLVGVLRDDRTDATSSRSEIEAETETETETETEVETEAENEAETVRTLAELEFSLVGFEGEGTEP
ncbi:hypothetical protein ACFYX8_01530 [Streptomyces cyaneofuscatus]|uniref:hypothetical protein n=1 Tax=Streptomyces TaxID=1883 RepID=UPI00037718F6|nr:MULTISPECIES: hypothetical protein [unclassified Streptomyces]MZF53658.1 hypothetical protein [Streptomyces sp. SID5594]